MRLHLPLHGLLHTPLYSLQRLLLENIAQLPDISDPPKVSSDGQFLILDGELPGESPTHTPPVVPRLTQPAPTPRIPPPAEAEDPESEA